MAATIVRLGPKLKYVTRTIGAGEDQRKGRAA